MVDIPLLDGQRGLNPSGEVTLQVAGQQVDLRMNFVPLARGELAIINVSYPKSGEGEGPAPISAKA